MLKFGNKEFRNLQEQVYKNMVDIQDVMQGATVLADFGIKVIGQVDKAADLPDPAEYEGEYGDAYMVGTEAPYDFYIFTRAFEGQEEPTWFNLGIFPQPGPQGPQGEAGTPVFPEIAVAASATTLAAGSNAKATVVSTGSDSNPLFTFTFEIPQGAQGIQGPQGRTGATGPMGPRGYINLLRPNADSCVAIGEGYMDETGNLQLLVSLDPKEFDNCGQLRGPRGYTGPQGPRGDAGYMSILRATAEDCVALGEGYMNSSGYLMILTDLDPRTFTNCGQLRGPAGSRGEQGPTGYVNIIRPNAESCTALYDAYVDSNGNLQILTALPDTFTYGGRIKGETGTAATIQVGNVITGEPGTPATVVNRGSSSAAIFDFTIPQGTPGEDVGINPVIPSGTPTSSLVAIKSGNDYYTVPQGETSLVFNVSIPSGETSTDVSTIKDGQNYYTIPSGTSSLTLNATVPSGTTPTDLAVIKDEKTNTYYSIPQGTGTANITFNPTVPSGTTPTALSTIKDDNTDTYYSITGGGGAANIEFNPTIPEGTFAANLTTLKDDNTNNYYKLGGNYLLPYWPEAGEKYNYTSSVGYSFFKTRDGNPLLIDRLATYAYRSNQNKNYSANVTLRLTTNKTPASFDLYPTGYKFTPGGSDHTYFDGNLGYNGHPWKDLYLSGSLKDGTNSVAIADIATTASLADKQDTLVSGTNIKTVNGQSILGAGNLITGEVEGNPVIPAGATVIQLETLRINDTYYVMPGVQRYIAGGVLIDNTSTSSISNNTLTDDSVDINTTTNTLII